MYKFICIEGNIGSGKTTLARQLAIELKTELIAESFESNPLLPLFYQHPEKYAFPLELSFLLDRYRQLKNSESLFKSKTVVSDYFIEKCDYFASINLHEKEYEDFHAIYSFLIEELKKPDLIIYLHSSPEHVLANIKKRNRKYEGDISLAYLQKTADIYHQKSKMEREASVVNFFMQKLDEMSYQKLFTEIVSILKSDIKNKVQNIQL